MCLFLTYKFNIFFLLCWCPLGKASLPRENQQAASWTPVTNRTLNSWDISQKSQVLLASSARKHCSSTCICKYCLIQYFSHLSFYFLARKHLLYFLYASQAFFLALVSNEELTLCQLVTCHSDLLSITAISCLSIRPVPWLHAQLY